jgi:Ala-tRNA(Pro) deacylase
VNNSSKNVSLVIDKKLERNGIINCHPLVNTATISIAFADMVKFIEHAGHNVTVTELC